MLWRKFQFFEKELLHEIKTESKDKDEKEKNTPDITSQFTPSLFGNSHIISATSGFGHLVFADDTGTIRIVDRDWHSYSFLAYDGYENFNTPEVSNHCNLLMQQMKQSNRLVTIGIDNNSSSSSSSISNNLSPILKVWSLDKLDINKDPSILFQYSFSSRSLTSLYNTESSEFSTFQNITINEITCLSVRENINIDQIAIGLKNGSIILLEGQGDMMKGRKPQITILQTHNQDQKPTPVTGLAFCDFSNSLFASNLANIYSFVFRNKTITKLVLDLDGGSESKCSCMNDKYNFVAGRQQAVYLYEHDEKGPCFAFDGPKKQISWFNNYLIVVISPNHNI